MTSSSTLPPLRRFAPPKVGDYAEKVAPSGHAHSADIKRDVPPAHSLLHITRNLDISHITAQLRIIWHIDTSVIRLLDGTRVYLHAVIDNFETASWRGGSTTTSILARRPISWSRQAAVSGGATPPMLLADGGVENYNGSVDEVIASGLLRRVLAQTENLLFELPDRSMVARAETPVALPPPTRLRREGAEARRLLRRGAQHPSPPFGVSRPDAGRDVLRNRRRCS